MPDRGSLYHFVPGEIIPPAELWEQIAENIDRKSSPGVLNALEDLAVEPPAAAWEAINNALDTDARTPAPPTRSIKPVYWKILAVAASIAVVFFIGVIFINHRAAGLAANVSDVVDSSLKTTIEARPDLAGNYITVTAQDGKPVHISSRLSKMVNAVYLSGSNSPESKVWKDRIKTWSGQINEVVIDSTLLNFADPVELLHFLKKRR